MRFALGVMGTHKLRSALTLLGVVAGVATVIRMVSFVVGFNNRVASKLMARSLSGDARRGRAPPAPPFGHAPSLEYSAAARPISELRMSCQPTDPTARTRRQLLVAQLAVAAWGAGFIARMSFVASDGVRRFSLHDDAMISLRYAWNLAHGNGLVWNPGERVEGYTNLLQTLLMALGCRVFSAVAAVLAVQVLGLVVCLATLAALRQFLLRADGPGAHRTLPSALLLIGTCLPFLSWPLLGMEAGLLALLITTSAAVVLGAHQEPLWRHALALGGLLGLAVLTRADGAVLAAAVLLSGLPGSRLSPLQRTASAVLPFLAAAGQAGWRLWYYGGLVPNTARLKVEGMPLLPRVENGIAYLLDFSVTAFPLLLALVIAIWRRRQPAARMVGVIVAMTGLYVLAVGGDAFPRWRFILPVLPLAAAVAAGELTRLGERLARHPRPRRALILLPTCLVALLINRGMLRQLALMEPLDCRELSLAHVELWIALDRVLDENASLGVLYAGTLPYYGARWRCIDFLGKTDPHVAGLPGQYLPGRWRLGLLRYQPGHNKFDLRFSILERRPTFIQTFSWRSQNVLADVRQLYVRCKVGGQSLLLRRDDPAVRWDRIESVSPL